MANIYLKKGTVQDIVLKKCKLFLTHCCNLLIESGVEHNSEFPFPTLLLQEFY
jgi:hypothetical protein